MASVLFGIMLQQHAEPGDHDNLMPTVAPLDLEGHVVGVAFLKGIPFFAEATGAIHRLDHGHKTTEVHEGLLSLVLDEANETLLTGGEDGKVMRTAADGTATLVAEAPRKWIAQVAAGPQGAVGYAYGKTTHVRLADGTTKEFAEERTVEGVAFAPKGLRVAAARYNGVSMHWVATAGQPIDLDWKGAHTGVTFSPDGRFLVTTMQENALHGWKLDAKPGGEARHMRMTGYPAKVKSLSWSAKGKWLASSGAPAVIGMWLGSLATSAQWSALALAIGAGAILQVIVEVSAYLMRQSGKRIEVLLTPPVMSGLVAGVAFMYVTAAVVKI